MNRHTLRALVLAASVVELVTTLAAPAAASPSGLRCLVPEGPVRAEAELADGGRLVARDGALELGARRWTPCEGLPGAFPQAVEVRTDPGTGAVEALVGFRHAGLHAFDPASGTFRPVASTLADEAIRALVTEVGEGGGADAVWVGTASRGLWRLVGDTVDGVRHGVLGRRPVTALALDHRGHLHVGAGAYGHWRVRFDPGQPVAGGPLEARIARIGRVKRGAWAACFRPGGRHHGVRAVAPGPGCALGEASPADGLPSAHATALADVSVTRPGRVAVGLWDAGVALVDVTGRAPVEHLEPLEAGHRLVNALAVEPRTGRLWVGTAGGLLVLEPGGDRLRVVPGLDREHVNALAWDASGQALWLGTGAGAVRLGPDRRVRRIAAADGLPSATVHSVAVAPDGAVWVGTARGLAILPEGGAGRVAPAVATQASGALPHDWVTAVLPASDGSGDAWVGTYDAGVVRLRRDGRRVARVRDARLAALGAWGQGAWVNPSGLLDLGSGRVAVAALGDGIRVVGASGEVVAYGRGSGLPSDDVTAAVDVVGRRVLATRGGLVVASLPLPGAAADAGLRPGAPATGRR